MSNYTDTLKRGDKIGCYQIEEVLGRGGFAVTYLATDMNLDVEVAIKEYLPREITHRDANLQVSARKPEFVEDYDVGLQNFAREAKTLARFKHPHIVRVHQVLHANNTAYMVMDFETGQELGEILETHKTLPEEELRAILFPILDGVEEIHRHGFVHRDIKPSNIYIRQNGSPVLIDFGAARYTMSETTQQLTAVVTVGYTPIEQYNVSEDTQGPWSDIYALAAVCYEAVSGDVPTDSVTRASASVTNGNDPLPSVRSMTKQQYTDDCLDAIDWGLRMEAEDRPQVIAQWRDAFDGIFNPASAYVEQKDVSIYSPHRVDKPRSSRQSNDKHTNYSDDVVSIPLHQTETPLDTGVVSLNTDSAVTRLPPVPPRGRDTEPTHQATGGNQFATRDNSQDASNNRPPSADRTQAANDMGSRNVLRRDTPESTNQPEQAHGEQPTPPEFPNRPRSKLERPSNVDYEQEPIRKRTLRDEIEFDESDWDYVPPKKNSPLRLLLPALGLAAVVGGSVLFVNYPDLISNLGKGGPELTTAQALDLAQEKMAQSDFIFPAGESALDYYQLILASDPDNSDAKAGIAAIETAVKAKISDNVEQDNLSEANRLLTRANNNGLQIYGLPEARQADNTSATPGTPIVPTTQGTVVTAVDTSPIEPVSPSQNTQSQVAQLDPVQPATLEAQPTIAPLPSSGIDNSLSPYIAGKIAEIETLVEQKRFSEARELYNDTDKYIPDQTASRSLLRKIEVGESEAIVQASSNGPATQSSADTTVALATPQSTGNTQSTETSPRAVPTVDRSQTSFISASGSTADHLNQLRIAIENKDIDKVTAISQGLPPGRTQFLTRMFQRYDRLDVSIDDVSARGNGVTAKLNVSMFKLDEDGAFYSAGKWSGVALNSTRQDGTWEKIRW